MHRIVPIDGETDATRCGLIAHLAPRRAAAAPSKPPPNACRVAAGQISPSSWCGLFVRKT
jgi:hypothetical protein